MATTDIFNSNGDRIAGLGFGEVDSDTYSLTLFGEGAEDFVQAMNQNWVRSAENFAATTPPTNPFTGQFWFDLIDRVPMVWDGARWLPLILGEPEGAEPGGGMDVIDDDGGDGAIPDDIAQAIEDARWQVEQLLNEGRKLLEDRVRLAEEAREDAERLYAEGQAFLNSRIDSAFRYIRLVDPEAGQIGSRVIEHSNAIAGHAIRITLVESVAENANAAVLRLSEAITTADYATAEDLLVVQSGWNTQFANTNARISNLANSISNDDGSFATLISEVRSDFETADDEINATIFELRQTTATATTAAADRLLVIESKIDAPGTGIRAVQIQHTQTLVDLEAGKASTSALDLLESEITTNYEILRGTVQTHNTTLADLPNRYVEATSFNQVKAELEGARGTSPNLASEISSVRQATVNGLAEKADATQFDTLKAEVVGARGGSLNLNAELARMQQVTVDGLANRATASEVDAIRLEITGARNGQLTLNAEMSRMRQAVIDGDANKASLIDFNDLKLEVSTARGASPNLTAALTSLRQAAIDGDAQKADAGEFNSIKLEMAGARNGSASLKAQLDNIRQAAIDGVAGTASASEFSLIKSEVENARGSAASVAARFASTDVEIGKRAATSVTDGISSRLNNGGDIFAAVDFARSTAVDALGKANADWSLMSNANGLISGIKNYNNGEISKVEIIASALRVSDGTNSTAPFVYSGGVLSAGSLRLSGSININNRFVVDAAGNVSITSATSGRRMTLNNEMMQAYDANRERARFGTWND